MSDRPQGCTRSGLHNCKGRFRNHDASHSPCMSCGGDRLELALIGCYSPTGHDGNCDKCGTRLVECFEDECGRFAPCGEALCTRHDGGAWIKHG